MHGGDVPSRALERLSHITIERCERPASDVARDFERLERDAVVFASHLEQCTITVEPNAPQNVRSALSNFAIRLLRSPEKRVAVLS